MKTFLPAFFCIFCVMALGIVSVAIGLQLIDPLLGLIALCAIVFALFSTSSQIEG